MLKINFHPTFWILAFVMVLQGKYLYLIGTVVAAILHEAGHARVAYNAGYSLNKITIMPYGAVLYGGEKIAKKDAVKTAIAGPLVNLSLVVLTTALWWIFPSIYPYTHDFWKINMGLFIFNLIPVYPLDGGRIILALAKSPLKTLKTMRNMGVVLSVIMLVLFVISAFVKINYSLGIIAIMIYISATSGTEKESYRHIASSHMKDWEQPILTRKWQVSHHLKLMELLRLIKNNQRVVFEVVDDDKKPIALLTEEELEKLCLSHHLRSTLKDHISSPARQIPKKLSN